MLAPTSYSGTPKIHRLDQRAARWLLRVDDRVDEARFKVMQEFLAQMIGVQRPAFSSERGASSEDAGLVRYTRGQISISDRDGLMARSCGCANVIASEERLDNTEGAYGAGAKAEPQV